MVTSIAVCAWCKEEYIKKRSCRGKFCSKICSGKSNSSKRIKKVICCYDCGKTIESHLYKNRCIDCKRIAHNKNNNADYHRRKDYVKMQRKAYYASNKQTFIERNKTRYYYKYLKGMSVQDYEQLCKECNYSCNICGLITDGKFTKKLYVDHDHSTKKIRGLLCQKCNSGLGMFKDNIIILSKAIVYLKK